MSKRYLKYLTKKYLKKVGARAATATGGRACRAARRRAKRGAAAKEGRLPCSLDALQDGCCRCMPTVLTWAPPIPPPGNLLQHNVRDWLRVIASNKDRNGERCGLHAAPECLLLLWMGQLPVRAAIVSASRGTRTATLLAPPIAAVLGRFGQPRASPAASPAMRATGSTALDLDIVTPAAPRCSIAAVYELRYFNIADQNEEDEEDEE